MSKDRENHILFEYGGHCPNKSKNYVNIQLFSLVQPAQGKLISSVSNVWSSDTCPITIEREKMSKSATQKRLSFFIPSLPLDWMVVKNPPKKSHIQLPMYISHGLRKVGIFHSSWRLVLDWLDGLSMGLLGVPTSLDYHLTCWDNTM